MLLTLLLNELLCANETKNNAMKTKCLIVDDEPLARDILRNYLGKLVDFEIVAECNDCMKALQTMREQRIDLIFMDVHMPQISGIEFLEIVKNPPKIIITTAHSEYAVKAFEFDVIDYLLKPFGLDRFLKSVSKYYESLGETQHTDDKALDDSKPLETCIYVKENKRTIKVNLAEIKYIEGLSEYVQIFTEKTKIITKTSLSTLLVKLSSEDFVRIHKSYIVSLNKVEAFSANTVELANKILPIGRSYKNAVLETMQVARET